MKVGSFGDIVFETNEDKIQTYFDKTNTRTMLTNKTSIINGRPILTYLGYDLDTIKFTMRCHSEFGSPPLEVKEKLDTMIDQGLYGYLITGDKPWSKNPFCLQTYTMTETNWHNGICIGADFQLELIEYNVKADVDLGKRASNYSANIGQVTSEAVYGDMSEALNEIVFGVG